MTKDNIDTLIHRIIQTTSDAMLQTHNLAGASAVFNQCVSEGLRQVLTVVSDEVQLAVHGNEQIQGWQYMGRPTIQAFNPQNQADAHRPRSQGSAVEQALNGLWMC